MTTRGKSYYYLTDTLGSVVALADDTGTKVATPGCSGGLQVQF